MTISDGEFVGYGATFNLGNYENERIDVRVRPEPGETFVQAAARARADVEAIHAQTLAVRKRARLLDEARNRLENMSYWIKQDHEKAQDYGLTVSFEQTGKPETDDELALIEWQIAMGEAERKAYRAAFERYREDQHMQQEANDHEDDRAERDDEEGENEEEEHTSPF